MNERFLLYGGAGLNAVASAIRGDRVFATSEQHRIILSRPAGVTLNLFPGRNEVSLSGLISLNGEAPELRTVKGMLDTVKVDLDARAVHFETTFGTQFEIKAAQNFGSHTYTERFTSDLAA